MRRIAISIASLLSVLGIALVVPGDTASAGGGGCHPGRPVTDERSTTVSMSGNCFVATVTRVDPGATVTFVNEDEAAHMVTGAAYSWGMGSDGDPERELYKDDTYTQTFDESGVYPYFCILHPSMVGAIVVGDGTGPGAATNVSADDRVLASTAPNAERGESTAAAVDASAGESANLTMTFAFVVLGAALLFGAVVLGRTLTARRASDG